MTIISLRDCTTAVLPALIFCYVLLCDFFKIPDTVDRTLKTNYQILINLVQRIVAQITAQNALMIMNNLSKSVHVVPKLPKKNCVAEGVCFY